MLISVISLILLFIYYLILLFYIFVVWLRAEIKIIIDPHNFSKK